MLLRLVESGSIPEIERAVSGLADAAESPAVLAAWASKG
jgi:hypothetical protein